MSWFDVDYDGRVRDRNGNKTNSIADSLNNIRTSRNWDIHDTGYVRDGKVFNNSGSYIGDVRNDNRPADRRR